MKKWIWTFKVINKSAYELPAAGGLGTMFFTVFGLMIIAMAGMGIMKRKTDHTM